MPGLSQLATEHWHWQPLLPALSTVASAYHLHSTQIVKFSSTTERGFSAELPGTPEHRTKDI